jgi:hypothetical protein
MYLFGIGAGMEHHIPPQLNAVRSIRGNAKEKKEKIGRGLTRVMMIKLFFCLHF